MLFTHNRVFKHKEVVSNLHVCGNGFEKMLASYIFHLPTTILISKHTKNFIFFRYIYMSRCPTINFQVSIMSKWLPKHISTKVSFKITTLKDMFTLTFVDLEYDTSFSIWDIWNHDRTLMLDLLLFQLATRLNSYNKYETDW